MILRSLKKAAPLLVNVAFLIGFFWLLFAVVGVQCFKSSFRRTCVWYDPQYDPFRNATARANGVPLNSWNNLQLCGGHLGRSTGEKRGWVRSDLSPSGSDHKGYLCPQNSLCVEGENPHHGTVSFDNVVQSLQLVFVIMSSNTFSDILYHMTDSDFLASALFFAFGIVIMSLWLMNLLVAVITSSFQVIREESKGSAFTTSEQTNPLLEEDEEEAPKKVNPLQRLYDKTYWVWIAVIFVGLVVQSLRTADMSAEHGRFIGMYPGFTMVVGRR